MLVNGVQLLLGVLGQDEGPLESRSFRVASLGTVRKYGVHLPDVLHVIIQALLS